MNREKRKGKFFLSLLLTAFMTLSLLPVSGQTAEVYADNAEKPAEEENALTENSVTYVPDPESLSDSEELLAEYVEEQFYGSEASTEESSGNIVLEGKSAAMSLFSGIETFSNYGGSRLSGRNLQIYNSLKESIAEVAAKGGSTKFAVTLDSPITWIGNRSQADDKFSANIDYNGIINCLLADSPYELYWYDKTTGTEVSYAATTKGQQISITKVNFTFFVADGYRGGSSTRVSTVRAASAERAAKTARDIAAKYASLSPYEQMTAFKNEICNLTDYNYSASARTDYGDPWQIIYVFDKDPDTNVVCEGYAKAFQYLCNLNGLTCYTVTGEMDGGTGAGIHMWNIVTLDGYNYLVDLTNSDTGTAGQNGGLFLAGTSGSMNTGYTFRAGSATITYKYDAAQIDLYGSSILTLASSAYTPSQTVPEVNASISASNVTYGYADAPKLSAVLQNAGRAGVTYQWYQVDVQGKAAPVANAASSAFTLPTGLDAGTYTYYCVANTGGQSAVSNRVTVTVAKAEVTPAVSGTPTKEYDGTVSGPSGIRIKLSGVISGDAVSASAQSCEYNSADVNTADQITASGITLSGADAGNYRLAADVVSASGSITPRAVTVTPDTGQSKKEGEEDPVLTYTITSGTVVSGETLQGQLSRTAGEKAGTYAITQGTLTSGQNSNYNILFGGNAAFTIVENITPAMTHTITFVADGVTVGTVTAEDGESVDAERFPEIPVKEGYDTISPVWDSGSIESLTSDLAVHAVYFSSQAQEAELAADAGQELKLILETGLASVPEELADNASLNTAEKIQAALQKAITQTGASADAANTSLYDVTLMADEGDGWTIADTEDFGADGKLTVTIPYPAGTGKETHEFAAAHMFTSADFGKQPGEIETLAVTKTDDGIQFTVTGLSPIMISWNEIQNTEPENLQTDEPEDSQNMEPEDQPAAVSEDPRNTKSEDQPAASLENEQGGKTEDPQNTGSEDKQSTSLKDKQTTDSENTKTAGSGNEKAASSGNTKNGTSGSGKTAGASGSPKTGDSSDTVMLYAALLASGAAAFAAAAYRKRRVR